MENLERFWGLIIRLWFWRRILNRRERLPIKQVGSQWNRLSWTLEGNILLLFSFFRGFHLFGIWFLTLFIPPNLNRYKCRAKISMNSVNFLSLIYRCFFFLELNSGRSVPDFCPRASENPFPDFIFEKKSFFGFLRKHPKSIIYLFKFTSIKTCCYVIACPKIIEWGPRKISFSLDTDMAAKWPMVTVNLKFWETSLNFVHILGHFGTYRIYSSSWKFNKFTKMRSESSAGGVSLWYFAHKLDIFCETAAASYWNHQTHRRSHPGTVHLIWVCRVSSTSCSFEPSE